MVTSEKDLELGATSQHLEFTRTETWETYGSFFSLAGNYTLTFKLVTEVTGSSGESVSFAFQLE